MFVCSLVVLEFNHPSDSLSSILWAFWSLQACWLLQNIGVFSSFWKLRDFRRLDSGLIEFSGGGREVNVSNSDLRVNTCLKTGNSKKGWDGKTRNKISLLILASCLKPAIIMSWVLLTDHGELLNDQAPCQHRLFHRKKDGISSQSSGRARMALTDWVSYLGETVSRHGS